jgi:hypothetical protein
MFSTTHVCILKDRDPIIVQVVAQLPGQSIELRAEIPAGYNEGESRAMFDAIKEFERVLSAEVAARMGGGVQSRQRERQALGSQPGPPPSTEYAPYQKESFLTV